MSRIGGHELIGDSLCVYILEWGSRVADFNCPTCGLAPLVGARQPRAEIAKENNNNEMIKKD